MRVNLKGIHRVRKTLASGEIREYHYAWRGGPLVWHSGMKVSLGSPEYIKAFAEIDPPSLNAAGTFRSILIAFQASAEWRKLSPRTRSDYKRWIDRIDEKFGSAPIESFNRIGIRPVALAWRDNWSGKQADYAWTVLVRITTWANDRTLLTRHHLQGVPRVYQSDRSEIVWTDADIAAFVAIAPPEVADGLLGASETGLRPGDLVRLTRAHVFATPAGRRIQIRTSKRKRLASIPVTPAMARIIDKVPQDQMLIFVNSHGGAWDEKQLSKQVTLYRRKAGLDEQLRLYDARGTACTRLMMAGATLQEIAVHMAWSIKTAAMMIETYARLDPSVSDSILIRLAQAKSGTSL